MSWSLMKYHMFTRCIVVSQVVVPSEENNYRYKILLILMKQILIASNIEKKENDNSNMLPSLQIYNWFMHLYFMYSYINIKKY